jgi:PhzF family phenazine biosynthesis protein
VKLPIYQVDAFTGELFRGNPAAVVILEEWLPDGTLIAIAAENNLSETAFLLPKGETFDIRWFTPVAEVDLCGHATLASGFVLLETAGLVAGEARFDSGSGPLSVRKEGDLFVMDFPSRPPSPAECGEDLVRALGAKPAEVHRSRDLVALFESQEDVARLAPDFARLAALDAETVAVTAPGKEADFVSRFFAPKLGVPEDPVTGSSFCTLAPFWAERLGKDELRALQISARGGEVFCEPVGDRVRIGGRAVLYLRGEIEIGR